MKQSVARAAAGAAVVVASGLAVVAPPPAHADTVTCVAAPKFSHVNLSGAQLFRASGECNGVYAFGVQTRTDKIRGRFYKGGSWKISSYGWVKIYKDNNGADKVVGNTIDGREIKGQAQTTPQQVSYLY
ncbi:hypothetical protein JK386_07420 [Nocardioides sp. zg-536]|uniref:Secreted protein n=1 Tax=Nocardioides faecalis TaxID=2803858 RepID=A0A939BSK8_9ACTN|nr:hypothetical protein [Nocardioides faecalis]MBM9459729.1 hypothetical protein [Nocardioides faecalis]MBS4753494.1 hypothetical protein [Nocardioides faecalis]QVI58248.1 hypothetical protein KG111_14715 [Nocardioides faecalis]